MSINRHVGPPEHAAAMTVTDFNGPLLPGPAALHDCHACQADALNVACPLCGAQPGQDCEDAVDGWIRRFKPHLARIEAAGGQR